MYNWLKKTIKKNHLLSTIYRKIIKADVFEEKIMELEEKVIYKYIFQLEKRVEELEKKLEVKNEGPKIHNTSTKSIPSLSNPISQVATENQVRSSIFKNWCQELNLPIYPNRKTWEFVYILQILKNEGMLKEGKSGVGFGVGKDPIVAYFAKNKVKILATDLHFESAQKKGWVSTNQYSKNILDLNARGIVSDRKLKEYTKFREVDMNQIPCDIKNYDFTWSACAFEHLGSINQGLNFVRNSLKCLKPGGIAIHTTEFNVSSNDSTVDHEGTVLFRKKDFQALERELKEEGHKIEFNFNTGDSSFDKFYDIPPYSDYTHLKLRLGEYITTSIGLKITKAL